MAAVDESSEGFWPNVVARPPEGPAPTESDAADAPPPAVASTPAPPAVASSAVPTAPGEIDDALRAEIMAVDAMLAEALDASPIAHRTHPLPPAPAVGPAIETVEVSATPADIGGGADSGLAAPPVGDVGSPLVTDETDDGHAADPAQGAPVSTAIAVAASGEAVLAEADLRSPEPVADDSAPTSESHSEADHDAWSIDELTDEDLACYADFVDPEALVDGMAEAQPLGNAELEDIDEITGDDAELAGGDDQIAGDDAELAAGDEPTVPTAPAPEFDAPASTSNDTDGAGQYVPLGGAHLAQVRSDGERRRAEVALERSVMAGTESLPDIDRVLVGLIVAVENGCDYWTFHLGRRLATWISDAEVDALSADWASAGLDVRRRALLAFVVKLTLVPDDMAPGDARVLGAVGFTGDDLLDIVDLVAYWNSATRVARGLGLTVEPAPAAD